VTQDVKEGDAQQQQMTRHETRFRKRTVVSERAKEFERQGLKSS